VKAVVALGLAMAPAPIVSALGRSSSAFLPRLKKVAFRWREKTIEIVAG